MPNTLLITGGAGNLACQLSFVLAERYDRIVLLDIAEGPVAETSECCDYARCDITDHAGLEAIVEREKPAAIIHFASLLSGSSEVNRPLAMKINFDASFALMEMAIAHGVGQFFFPSSLAAYGGVLPDPMPEETMQWPDGIYGVTKAAVERLGVYYHRKHGLDFRCLRLPIIVSPYAPAGASSAYASRAFVEAVQNGSFTFKVRPGTTVSTMYVGDCLRAIAGLLHADPGKLTQRVYNIHALAPSGQDIADAVAARIPDAALTFDPDDAVADLIASWPSIIEDATARRDWGWLPKYDLDAMADDMVRRAKELSNQ